MKKFIDLTHEFTSQMPVFPGDPPAQLSVHSQSDFFLKTGMHVGTHIDAPLHMIENGKRICDFPISHFIGGGQFIDARGAQSIDAPLLKRTRLGRGHILLIFTAWDAHFHSANYYENFPEITEAFARQAIARGVKMIGMDTPSPDRAPYSIHKLLLSRNILIIENVTNLKALARLKNFEVAALPLKIEAEASPARVIARVLQ